MKKRILFLDDDLDRHRKIQPYLLPKKAFTAQEAIACLKNDKFDIVFLDHDLGGLQMVESEGPEETGYTVAKWIAENKPVIPLVVVHSLNTVGAENIAELLKNCGYSVAVVPFYMLKEHVDAILEWEPEVS